MTKLEHYIDQKLFVRPNFLPAKLCDAICEDMRMSSHREAGTVLDGKQALVDERTRKAKNVAVALATRQAITSRLQAIAPDVAEHFGSALTGLQELQFLAYNEGDFFAFHRDSADSPTDPRRVRERKVSTVIFLNAKSDRPGPDSYGGGALEFYAHDLIAEPMYEQAKIPFAGTPGTLVAFDPFVRHQVEPVTHGQRFTVVTWFV
jgi:predicted 2-oxoglutarate/Fe(II)-dependent dioxygenase YbiX